MKEQEREFVANAVWKRLGVFLAALIVIVLLGLAVWRIAWVTFVDNYEMAFSYDRMSGQIEKIDRTGWIIRTPFVYSVHAIDLRPYQVTISANQRILNAKLVRFNPEGLKQFVEWHGRDAADSTGWLLEILKCYAFDMEEGRDCPFLTIVNVVSPRQGPSTAVNHSP